MNMGVSSGLPLHKGKTRKQIKAKQDRAESKVVKAVREDVSNRDGFCRFNFFSPWNWASTPFEAPPVDDKPYPHRCEGPSEWAHFGAKKRARTRGQAPEVRHTTAASLMLCHTAHEDYDAGRLKITALTRKGCDGRLKFRRQS